MMSADQLLSQLAESYQDLSPRLRQVAKFIVDAPEEVPLHTMRGLARKLDVPASTMVRLAGALGFSSYEEFRKPLEQALRRRGEAFSDRAKWLQNRDPENKADEVIFNIANSAKSNLDIAYAELNPEDIEKAAILLLNAKTTYVVGVGAMRYTSGYFYSIARMVLDNVVSAGPLGAENFDDLNSIGEADVFFTTAFKPCSTAIVRTVKFAAQRGAKIILLTDSLISPVAREATVTFIVPTTSPQFFPSQTAVISILESLVAVLVAKGGENSIKRIEGIVEFREEMGLYWRERHIK